jgi:hypothetical protein
MSMGLEVSIATRVPQRQPGRSRGAHPLQAMLRRAGLKYIESDALTIRR